MCCRLCSHAALHSVGSCDYVYNTDTEYCSAPYQVVMRIPEDVGITEAAGLRKEQVLHYKPIYVDSC